MRLLFFCFFFLLLLFGCLVVWLLLIFVFFFFQLQFYFIFKLYRIVLVLPNIRMATLCGMWDLSSGIRDPGMEPMPTAREAQILKHWPAGEVPQFLPVMNNAAMNIHVQIFV